MAVSGLKNRVVSALVYAISTLVIYLLFANVGIAVLSLGIIIMASYEMSRLIYTGTTGSLYYWRWFFVIANTTCFLALVLAPDKLGLLVFTSMLVGFIGVDLAAHRKTEDIGRVLNELGLSLVGLLYLGFLPHFGGKLILSEHGDIWFLFIMAIPFIGDISAYFAGRWLGRRHPFPFISPHKTIEGSLAGLLGSMATASAIELFIPSVSFWMLPLLGLLIGVFAQFGDFFESLLKRVRDVKDSGHLMPGHGGILDRIDGLIFACPILYAFVFINDLI